jgi:glycosyltransferase involved in cell wall biosynthesis
MESPLSRIRGEQLEMPGVLRELGADLYHGLAFVAPLRAPCPTVVTVHDLSFITRPETHKLANRLYLAVLTLWSCRRAARVIAVSEWTKRDVVNLLHVEPDRVDVIPHGVHARYHPLPEPEVQAFRRAHHIGDHAIFFLGSLEPRKNLPTLIEAFAALRTRNSELRTQTQLIIGGSPGWKYEPIFARMRALGLEDCVMFPGQIAQDELPLWYNACAVFAYPSLYEGFGLPVLEALACGAPVVTSNVTSLPEVVGKAGYLVEPTDVQGLGAALQGVLGDESLRRQMSEQSRRRAAQFTWARTAELTLQTYRRAIKSR